MGILEWRDCSEGGFCLLANGVADHVQLLARLRQDKAVSDVLRRSRQTLRAGFMMTSRSSVVFIGKTDYSAFTVGKSQMETVRRYIAGRKLTFQEEFLALLNAHEIEYDERYIWKCCFPPA